MQKEGGAGQENLQNNISTYDDGSTSLRFSTYQYNMCMYIMR